MPDPKLIGEILKEMQAKGKLPSGTIDTKPNTTKEHKNGKTRNHT